MTGPTFNQNHSGSGDNVVNYGAQPFKITDKIVSYIRDTCDKSKPIIMDLTGSEAATAGFELQKMLQEDGFVVQIRSMVGSMDWAVIPPRMPPKEPLYIVRYDDATLITIETK